jgi:hypothetical protein
VTGAQPVLPILAAVALTALHGHGGSVLAAARRGQVLHLLPLARTGAGVTPHGRVRRVASPLCRRRTARWRLAGIDGRPLCQGCERELLRRCTPADVVAACGRLDDGQWSETFRTARDTQTLHLAKLALFRSAPGGLRRLSAEARFAADRLNRTPAAPLQTWTSTVKVAPASRFPRRVAS